MRSTKLRNEIQGTKAKDVVTEESVTWSGVTEETEGSTGETQISSEGKWPSEEELI